MIPAPFLLYLGHAQDPADIKTSRGMATFRKEDCIGEFRHDDCPLTLGLPRLTVKQAVAAGARTLVLGIAVAGGRLNPALVADAEAALAAGMNVAAGLHDRLRDNPVLAAAAQKAGASLFDVREPPTNLPVGNGRRRAGKRLLTVGTDCSSGKMFTTLVLTEALRARGIAADFRATGQTGILIAGEGIPVDAVVADFISGAIETLSPARDDNGWDCIEGQGSLFHPSFAGVSTGLLHGAQPDALVLCHDPVRKHLRGLAHYPLPEIGRCIEENLRVAALTNPDVRMAGIALNTSHLDEAEARGLCAQVAATHGLACTDPYRFGADALVDHLLTISPAA
jgi:uncharacterized NAD-dependent epimerase/dehydratase family protein